MFFFLRWLVIFLIPYFRELFLRLLKSPQPPFHPKKLWKLSKKSADPQNLVYIISGRDSAFLEQHLGHLKNVGFSAEHGGFFRERKADEWTNLTKSLDMSWMSEVEEIFRYYTEVCWLLFCLFLCIILGMPTHSYLEDDGKSYRSEEKFDNVALPWKRS